MIFLLTFSTAFDTIQCTIVLKKTHALGFTKTFLTWMVSYLSDRLQHIQLDNKKFKLERVGFGVPHGSILGPIKFYLYVTDLQATYSATTFNMQMIQRSTIIRSLVISKTVSLKQTMPLNGTMTALAIRIRYI